MTRALQKLIHVGCRELGLDADGRRALQLAATGKSSMSDMTETELTLVLDRLKADGFRVKRSGRRPAAPRKDLKLIHVLWRKLGDAGALKRPGRDGLNAFIRSSFAQSWGVVPADVDMLRDHDKIAAVISALMAWGKRENIDFDFSRYRA
ncbi:regulatory protein GemA [Cognatiyoonia sp. IB215182]|uniref:gp16 family protein n=1 Tax=Cognatiyoonia sp. IB215182 TaxID=3097353 RepID=UPI002A0AAEEC|nr:regulatory protein GemA [Cognatiyoonia sp. IB215182]MDX8354333.1 regulatory protein GemA [Cognatiyoonia sp. IB215182]